MVRCVWFWKLCEIAAIYRTSFTGISNYKQMFFVSLNTNTFLDNIWSFFKNGVAIVFICQTRAKLHLCAFAFMALDFQHII